MLLVSHAGPTAPPLDELLLDELLEPLEPLVPLEPLEPELPDVPEVPLEPLELVVEPVSGVVAESAAGAPLSSVPGVFVGSGFVATPASGAGSVDLVSWTALPISSAGDVAHADASARTESAATANNEVRRMAGTLPAELCSLLPAHLNETLR